jgi:hypothetical protein
MAGTGVEPVTSAFSVPRYGDVSACIDKTLRLETEGESVKSSVPQAEKVTLDPALANLLDAVTALPATDRPDALLIVQALPRLAPASRAAIRALASDAQPTTAKGER